MDPDETLRLAEAATRRMAEAREAWEYENAAVELATQFSSLDAHLSNGGSLPEAWQR